MSQRQRLFCSPRRVYTARAWKRTVCSPAFRRFFARIPAKAGTTNIGQSFPRAVYLPVSLAVAVLSLCLLSAARGEGPILLRDVTGQTGITFRHDDGSSGRRYIVEYVASGLATLDYDGDGLTDIYFLTGGSLPGAKHAAPPTNRLYRNLGHFRFADVTEKAGVGYAGQSLGVCAGDYDNDGFPDIYVSNFGPNVLYHNRGDGTFADVTEKAGVGRGNKVGAGVAFLDMDGDGNLDLYASNYVKFSYENQPPRKYMGVPIYPSPLDFAPEPDNLFRNNGDGTFTDVSETSGIAARSGTGMGIICADYNGDGNTDVFVANDVMPNFLWRNDGQGHFEEAGLASGVAFDVSGLAHGNMGVDCGDYDNDGRLDFFVTAYQREWATLYRNLGGGVFSDVTQHSGAGRGSYNNVKWGCGLVDFDNDGHKDLFLAVGHLFDNVESFDDTTSYEARNVLLRNLGNGTFVDVSAESGIGTLPKRSGRGVAFDDLDNDGRIDVVILEHAAGADGPSQRVSRREPLV